MRSSFHAFAGLVAAAVFVLLSCGTGFAQVIDERMWVTNGPVHAVVRDGKTIYLGGNFSRVGPVTGGGAVLDAVSGTLPPTFPKVNGDVYAVIPDAAGGWYIGGSFSAVGGIARSNVARVSSDLSVSAWDPGADNGVFALERDGSIVYAGGAFSAIGGQARGYIAALNGATGAATSWNPAADGYVDALEVGGTKVYAGGDFTVIGGQPRNRIAALDPATGMATAWDPNADLSVYTLAVSGSAVIAGGVFRNIGGQPRTYLLPDATTERHGVESERELHGPRPGGEQAHRLRGRGLHQHRRAATQPARRARRRERTATAWNPNATATFAPALSGSIVYAAGRLRASAGRRSRVVARCRIVTPAA